MGAMLFKILGSFFVSKICVKNCPSFSSLRRYLSQHLLLLTTKTLSILSSLSPTPHQAILWCANLQHKKSSFILLIIIYYYIPSYDQKTRYNDLSLLFLLLFSFV